MLIGDMNARVGNNRVSNIVGTNGEATLNSSGRKLIDICIFNNLKITNTSFKHKEIHKFTWEASRHKSIIDYFITNMKISKAIQDIRVYRSNEISSDHYLLCAKVNFPPRWLNKSNKKTPLEQDEFFKARLLNDESIRWMYTERLKLHLSNSKKDEIDIEKERKNLQNLLKSAANESLGIIKRRNGRKYIKIQEDQIKQQKQKNHIKWLNSKKLEYKLEYKRNTALVKREVRRRQRLSWDKIVTNLENDTYRTQPKVYKILKQISKNVKETAHIQLNKKENAFLQYYEKLWNTNINELQLEYNSADYSHASITSDELEKVLKLIKNGKAPGQDNINSEL